MRPTALSVRVLRQTYLLLQVQACIIDDDTCTSWLVYSMYALKFDLCGSTVVYTFLFIQYPRLEYGAFVRNANSFAFLLNLAFSSNPFLLPLQATLPLYDFKVR